MMTDEQNKRGAAAARNIFFACAGAQILIYTLIGIAIGPPWTMRLFLASCITSAPFALLGAVAHNDAQ